MPGLGAHKRSHPDLKLLTKLEMSSPDLSAVRVQRRASVQCVSANPNVVRVRGAKFPKFFSFFWYTLERNLVLERRAEDGAKKVTSTKETNQNTNTKESSHRNSTDSGFKRLKVKIRYSYSFVKEFHWLPVIPVNTGEIQGPIA